MPNEGLYSINVHTNEADTLRPLGWTKIASPRRKCDNVLCQNPAMCAHTHILSNLNPTLAVASPFYFECDNILRCN